MEKNVCSEGSSINPETKFCSLATTIATTTINPHTQSQLTKRAKEIEPFSIALNEEFDFYCVHLIHITHFMPNRKNAE